VKCKDSSENCLSIKSAALTKIASVIFLNSLQNYPDEKHSVKTPSSYLMKIRNEYIISLIMPANLLLHLETAV
jgi:hypothetical protein